VQKTIEKRREAPKSGGLVQGRKDATCCLGCGRANITEAGTRGQRAVIAPRERKLRLTNIPGASPARARALRIPGLEGTGGVRGEIPRQSENSRLIPVEMATP
jgi:hypothetical protein